MDIQGDSIKCPTEKPQIRTKNRMGDPSQPFGRYFFGMPCKEKLSTENM